MNKKEAEDNLKFIKNLMENSTRYGDSLAGIFLFLGLSGTTASLIASFTQIGSCCSLLNYWMSLAIAVAATSAIVMIIKAKKGNHGMSSIYKVATSVIPPCIAGAVIGIAVSMHPTEDLKMQGIVVCLWVILFGCALNATSFIILKGLKYLSWVYIYSGSFLIFFILRSEPNNLFHHCIMGFFFGLLFIGYSILLFLVEKKKNSES